MKTAKEWLKEHKFDPDNYYTNELVISIMEEYHQERMREELIKFIEWFRIEVCTEDVPIEDDYFADKYLNQKYE